MRSARTGGPGAAWPRADVSDRRRLRAGSREDELLVPPVPQRDGGRRAAIADPHRRREFRPRVAAEVHLLPGGQEARRAALRDLDLHLPEPLCHGPGGIPELERPPATPMLPALMSDVGAQQLAILIAELDGDVGARDDERLLHLHRCRLRAAGGILVVGPPVAVVVHAVAAVLTRRRGDRARLHGADLTARSLRTDDTPLVRARRRAAGGGIDRGAAGEGRARL